MSIIHFLYEELIFLVWFLLRVGHCLEAMTSWVVLLVDFSFQVWNPLCVVEKVLCFLQAIPVPNVCLQVFQNRLPHYFGWFQIWSSSLTASCVARFMICWVCRLYFSGLVFPVLSLDDCLIKINYGRFCVCFRCLEKVILCSSLCLAKDEFRYHR